MDLTYALLSSAVPCYVSTQTLPLCATLTCHESQQSYSHPASVIESLVLRELKILDLGSKKTP